MCPRRRSERSDNSAPLGGTGFSRCGGSNQTGASSRAQAGQTTHAAQKQAGRTLPQDCAQAEARLKPVPPKCPIGKVCGIGQECLRHIRLVRLLSINRRDRTLGRSRELWRQRYSANRAAGASVRPETSPGGITLIASVLKTGRRRSNGYRLSRDTEGRGRQSWPAVTTPLLAPGTLVLT
jgi:hypothetical protein